MVWAIVLWSNCLFRAIRACPGLSSASAISRAIVWRNRLPEMGPTGSGGMRLPASSSLSAAALHHSANAAIWCVTRFVATERSRLPMPRGLSALVLSNSSWGWMRSRIATAVCTSSTTHHGWFSGRDAGYPAPPGQIRTCALAHTAPLPGMTVGAETHPAVSARTSCATGHPARCPAHVESSQIPRESGPWLLRLRRGSRPLFAGLTATMAESDCFTAYISGVRLLPSRCGPPPRQELSRGHRGALPGPGVGHTYVPELLDTARPDCHLPITRQPVLPSAFAMTSASRTIGFSVLHHSARMHRY